MPKLGPEGKNFNEWMVIFNALVRAITYDTIPVRTCFIIGSRVANAGANAPYHTVNVLDLTDTQRDRGIMRGISDLLEVQWAGWFNNRPEAMKTATSHILVQIFLSIDPQLLHLVKDTKHPAITICVLKSYFASMTTSRVMMLTEKMFTLDVHNSEHGNSYKKCFANWRLLYSTLQNADQAPEASRANILMIRALKKVPQLSVLFQAMEADQANPISTLSNAALIQRIIRFIDTNGGDKIKSGDHAVLALGENKDTTLRLCNLCKKTHKGVCWHDPTYNGPAPAQCTYCKQKGALGIGHTVNQCRRKRRDEGQGRSGRGGAGDNNGAGANNNAKCFACDGPHRVKDCPLVKKIKSESIQNVNAQNVNAHVTNDEKKHAIARRLEENTRQAEMLQAEMESLHCIVIETIVDIDGPRHKRGENDVSNNQPSNCIGDGPANKIGPGHKGGKNDVKNNQPSNFIGDGPTNDNMLEDFVSHACFMPEELLGTIASYMSCMNDLSWH